MHAPAALLETSAQSGAATLTDKVNAAIDCPICGIWFTKPVVNTTCGHVFCEACICKAIEDGIIPLNGAGPTRAGRQKKVKFQCPVCCLPAHKWMLRPLPVLEAFIKQLSAEMDALVAESPARVLQQPPPAAPPSSSCLVACEASSTAALTTARQLFNVPSTAAPRSRSSRSPPNAALDQKRARLEDKNTQQHHDAPPFLHVGLSLDEIQHAFAAANTNAGGRGGDDDDPSRTPVMETRTVTRTDSDATGLQLSEAHQRLPREHSDAFTTPSRTPMPPMGLSETSSRGQLQPSNLSVERGAASSGWATPSIERAFPVSIAIDESLSGEQQERVCEVARRLGGIVVSFSVDLGTAAAKLRAARKSAGRAADAGWGLPRVTHCVCAVDTATLILQQYTPTVAGCLVQGSVWVVAFGWIVQSEAERRWAAEGAFECRGSALHTGSMALARSMATRAGMWMRRHFFYFDSEVAARSPKLLLVVAAAGGVCINLEALCETAATTSVASETNPAETLFVISAAMSGVGLSGNLLRAKGLHALRSLRGLSSRNPPIVERTVSWLVQVLFAMKATSGARPGS